MELDWGPVLCSTSTKPEAKFQSKRCDFLPTTLICLKRSLKIPHAKCLISFLQILWSRYPSVTTDFHPQTSNEWRLTAEICKEEGRNWSKWTLSNAIWRAWGGSQEQDLGILCHSAILFETIYNLAAKFSIQKLQFLYCTQNATWRMTLSASNILNRFG